MAQSTITYVCSAQVSDHELPDVQTTIDSPSEVVGRALLFHGFGRKPDALDELVGVLVENNIEVVRPYLKSKARLGGMNDRDLMPTRDVRAFAGWALRGLYGVEAATISQVVFPGLDLGTDPGLLL